MRLLNGAFGDYFFNKATYLTTGREVALLSDQP